MTTEAPASALNVWFWRQMATWSGLLKRDEMALEYWERIAAVRPRDPKVLASLAHHKAQRGGRPEAIALLERALAIDPSAAGAWYNHGFLLQESQRHDEAIASFDRAVAINDKLDQAHYGKALSLIKTGRLEDAIAPLRRNTELQPLSPFGFYQLAHVYHRLERPEQVAKVIRRVQGFEPQVARQIERETGVVVGAAADR
jgi:tetratricopeptide (TPR) repeat protein